MALNIERFKKDLNDLRHRGSMLECAIVRDVHGIQHLRNAVGEMSDDEFARLRLRYLNSRTLMRLGILSALPF